MGSGGWGGGVPTGSHEGETRGKLMAADEHVEYRERREQERKQVSVRVRGLGVRRERFHRVMREYQRENRWRRMYRTY